MTFPVLLFFSFYPHVHTSTLPHFHTSTLPRSCFHFHTTSTERAAAWAKRGSTLTLPLSRVHFRSSTPALPPPHHARASTFTLHCCASTSLPHPHFHLHTLTPAHLLVDLPEKIRRVKSGVLQAALACSEVAFLGNWDFQHFRGSTCTALCHLHRWAHSKGLLPNISSPQVVA